MLASLADLVAAVPRIPYYHRLGFIAGLLLPGVAAVAARDLGAVVAEKSGEESVLAKKHIADKGVTEAEPSFFMK